MTKHQDYIEELREIYSAYPELSGGELSYLDKLEENLDKSVDGDFVAFRENPFTIKLAKHAVSVYRSCSKILSDDDGSLTSEARLRLHTSRLWAQWYIKALGRDPKKEKKALQKEIEDFAKISGLPIK